MLDVLRILFALGLPLLTGALFVAAACPRWRQGGWALLLGWGFPLGLLGVVCGYVLLDRMGFGLHFAGNVVLQLGLAAVFAALAWWRSRRLSVAGGERLAGQWADLTPGWRWLVALLVAWVCVRWLGVVLEVSLRPLLPWDAWWAYSLQGKVWFYAGTMDVFTGRWGWFAATEPAWMAGGTRHPPGVGLLNLWMAHWLGRWDEALISLPWGMLLGTAFLAMFGVMRLAGATLVLASVVGWALVSVPMFSTHAALGGYGDMWVGVFFLLAGSGLFLAWSRAEMQWVAPALLACLGMFMFKQSGALWLPILLVGLVAAVLPWRVLIITVLVGLPVLILWLWEPGSGLFVVRYWLVRVQDGAWVLPDVTPVLRALWHHMVRAPTWHLFWLGLLVAVAAAIPLTRRDNALRFLWVTVVTGVSLLLAVFLFTRVGSVVIDGTTGNRALLHVVPLAVFFCGIVFQRFARSELSTQKVTG